MDELAPIKITPFDFGPFREAIGSGRKLIAETMESLEPGEGKDLLASILHELDDAKANFERITPPAMEEMRQTIESSIAEQISQVEQSKIYLLELKKLKESLREADLKATLSPEESPFHAKHLFPVLPSNIEESPAERELLTSEDLLKFLLGKETAPGPVVKTPVLPPKISGNIWENWSDKNK